ncbi:dethiobiotin synthase [Leptospira sp. GIMC2001]|uniref:dethiobiotin synthase n=1 Tax=Leptospira sp. GIMC2001 TaxID=1513297 RepID=UPI00234B0920|nr:dethiobiotin synthase [Leptospira sp. GIMC2001]WCL50372.1 dethiobiotin synthase [Leptospira sp. GIMC2001]
MSIFITATGTDIGKTMIALSIMVKYGIGNKLLYWKPVQTGIDDNSQPSDSDTIANCLNDSSCILPEGYKFIYPASPHLSASKENSEVSLEFLNLFWDRYKSQAKLIGQEIIVEGAGGIMVPLNRKTLTIDWIHELNIPVLLVVSTSLGTINHSLMSLEMLRNRNIPVIGFFGYGEMSDIWIDSKDIISEISGFPCLGEFFVPKINGEILKKDKLFQYIHKYFDTEEKLSGLIH